MKLIQYYNVYFTSSLLYQVIEIPEVEIICYTDNIWVIISFIDYSHYLINTIIAVLKLDNNSW